MTFAEHRYKGVQILPCGESVGVAGKTESIQLRALICDIAVNAVVSIRKLLLLLILLFTRGLLRFDQCTTRKITVFLLS